MSTPTPKTSARSESETAPPKRRASLAGGYGAPGFTLLEVLVAVAILSISLTSLLTSQMNALRATRYAQSITAMAFLAESKLVDIEYQIKEEEDGWGDNDKEYEGDFSEEGWPEVTYKCVADMIEMPEYSALQRAADAADAAESQESGVDVQDVGEQAFDSLAMVWPIIKEAIERAIRKSHCTVYWSDGNIDREFRVDTFWTDPAALTQLPSLGGEEGEEGDTGDDDGGGDGGAGGTDPAGGGGSGRPQINTGNGPATPPSRREK
ncbi:MAG: prepilin-type N-terminal cleavage/methylation domain-containing protein [Nannocystaceae bacterium]|nr:type II secretion system GspH family protein [bacterium]